MGIVEESDAEVDENIADLQENYNFLLENSGEYAREDKAVMKKMKKANEDYRSLVARYKEAKCEIEMLNGKRIEAYTKVKFLELEVVQANAKTNQVSTKKLDDVISSKKYFSDKTELGYTGESSTGGKVTKDVKFVKAKDPKGFVPIVEKANVEKKKKNTADQRVLNKRFEARPEAKGRSPPKSQRGLIMNHVCHHCGLQGHTRPNFHKLRALNNAWDQRSRGPRDDKRNWAVGQLRSQNEDFGVMDVMKMIEAFTTCLANFNNRFEGHNSCTQSYKDITPNAHDVWVKRGTHA